MPELLVAGVVGLITGVIGSIFGPWVHWGIDKRRLKLENRRELIRRWRDMANDVRNHFEPGQELTFYEFLERQPAFLSLEPRLSAGEKELLKKNDMSHDVVTVVRVSTNVTRVNPIDDFIRDLSYRIGQIEKDWDLV